MEKIYKKINLKKITDKINIKILLYQDFNDIGISNSAPKIKSEWETPVFINDSLNPQNPLVEKLMDIYPISKLRLISEEITPSKPIEDYYKQGGIISYITESRLPELEQRVENKYIVGLNIDGSELLSINGDEYNYIIDEILNYTTDITNGNTTATYKSQGWNDTNIELGALYKKDYLFGYINEGKINSDVFIDRGITSVNDYHLPLIEIDNLDKLIQYNDNFYNITR